MASTTSGASMNTELAGLITFFMVVVVIIALLWLLLPAILMRTNGRLDKTNELLADVVAGLRRIESQLQSGSGSGSAAVPSAPASDAAGPRDLLAEIARDDSAMGLQPGAADRLRRMARDY